VYPIPAKSFLTIEYKLNHSDWIKFYIYDIMGRMVKKIERTGDKGILMLDLKEFDSGIYFLAFSSTEGEFFKKVVICK